MQNSFNGGIISPDMYGRPDQAKYQNGLAECTNFHVEMFGGATFRAGFQYVYHFANVPIEKIRLIPFVFSEEQAIVIGLFAGGARLFTEGGILLDQSGQPINLTLPYAEQDLMSIRYAQSADVITLTHPSYAPRKIVRISATSWTTEVITASYGAAAPTSVNATATIQAKYQAGGAQAGSYNPRTYSYAVTAIYEESGESPQSDTVSVTNDLTLAGNTNTITWLHTQLTPNAGPRRFNVYKLRSGLACYIGETTATSFTDDNIEHNGAITPPLIRDPFQYNPTAVAYFGQRKVYGGGNLSPQWIRMSRTATDDNFEYHIPSQDTDSIQLRFAARDGNGVKHLVSLGDLAILTSGAVWRLAADGAVTASSLVVRPQSYVGANDVTPIQTGGAVIFSSDQTGHVHELSVSQGFSSGFQVLDLSLFCPHLFDGYQITDCALLTNPMTIAYFVRSDGKLLSFTYEPQQQVWAWAVHETDGAVLSVAAIPEQNQTVLYAAILRDGRRVIERMLMRQPVPLQDQCYLDSSIQYNGAATNVINGLTWLANRTVSVFADGGVKPPATVSASGELQLDRPYSKVWIGLPYNGTLQTLPLYSQRVAISTPKKADKAFLRVQYTQAVQVGTSPDKMVEYKPRSNENYGVAPNLINGVIEIALSSVYTRDIQILVKHDKPLPMKLLTLEVDFK